MQEVREVEAIAGAGLQGDRYATGAGSFNKGNPGKRQVTLINGRFFSGSGFTFAESRRNLVTEDVELMRLIGRGFRIGTTACFHGVKYCHPCNRPSDLANKQGSFRGTFFDCGGLIAEVTASGVIRIRDPIISLPK